MNQFVYDAIEFLREFKFNGLDVDWEYPRGADDKVAYLSLLKELRLAFEGNFLRNYFSYRSRRRRINVNFDNVQS